MLQLQEMFKEKCQVVRLVFPSSLHLAGEEVHGKMELRQKCVTLIPKGLLL